MSLEVDPPEPVAGLRAVAHPLRLQMLSLLSGAAMSAAELARELDVSQALASYHLRKLVGADLLVLDEERSHRGGRERRYRYQPRTISPTEPGEPGSDEHKVDVETHLMLVEALSSELRRRSRDRATEGRGLVGDAEMWLAPEDWERARDAAHAITVQLHEQARRPHEPGTVHVSATFVMFQMTDTESLGEPR